MSRFLYQLDKEEFKSLLKESLKEILLDERIFNTDKELLNIKEAAAFLNLAVNTLYEKTSERSIPHYKHGKKITFKRAELIEWVQSRKVSTYDEIKHLSRPNFK
ncbi:MAG: helix-turn-helix domain-containing protein [Cyclobacteriaceae bacterium]|nr:helix-turn-helix domain-containing protein [Cyclobacteriaceae bacterium]